MQLNRPVTRRTFVGAAATLALDACATAKAPRPQRVIDPHTHFYDPTRPEGVPWPPRNDKLLYRTVLPNDYKAIAPSGVAGTVVVEASPWLEDNQWILDLAAREPFIIGFVGNLPVGTAQCAPALKRFSANPLFRGIRIGPREFDSATKRDLALLADRDLSLDLLGGLEIITLAQDIARAIPSLRIVIDHVANVHIDGKEPPKDWIDRMSEVAKFKNVFCKISGLVEGTNRKGGKAPRDAQFYAPILDHTVALFGPNRLIYASNWPVSAEFAPLSTVQGIVTDYFAAHPQSVRDSIFWRSSQRAYKWKVRRA